jgi:hypothetical protein
MANSKVNVYSDPLFNLYRRLNLPGEKGSQNGWPYGQTETGLRIFQEAAEPYISGTTQSAPSSSSPSSPPKLQNRLIWLQTFWPICIGALLVICCVLALVWQAHRRALANARLQDQYTETPKIWGEAPQRLGQCLLAEVRALNTNLAAFTRNQNQIIAGLVNLSRIDTELAGLVSSQADASRRLAAAQSALAQETTNLVVSLRQTFQQRFVEAASQSRADTAKLQAQIAEETTNLVVSLRQTFQRRLAEAASQSRADTAKLQAQIAGVAASYQALLDRVSGPTNVPNLALALPGVTGWGTSKQAAEKYRTTTPNVPGIESPDKVHTRLGTLKFSDGSPDKRTSEMLFDNLDFQRAVQAYLLALPPVSMLAIREGLTQWGPPNATILIFVTLTESRSLFLTANYSTPYTWLWINLRNGPLVAEIPPQVSGMINDSWFRNVTDVGFAGPDKGAGGKYLILPPGYEGVVPQGYLVVKAPTFEGFLGWRNFLVNEDPKLCAENIRKFTRVYALSQAANPPTNKFITISGQAFNAVAPADYQFWEYLNQVVQGEPSGSLDRVTLGYYGSIGIQKGMAFTPDARMKKILAEAAAVGDATARAIAFHTRQKDAYYFPSSLTLSWPPAPLPPWK